MVLGNFSSVSRAHESNWMTTCVSKLRGLRPVEQMVVGVAALALTGFAYNAIRRVFTASLWRGLAVTGFLSGVGIYLFRKCFLAPSPNVIGIRSLHEDDKIVGLNQDPCNGWLDVSLPQEKVRIVANWKDGRPTTGPASVTIEGRELLGQCNAEGLFEDGLPVIPRPLLTGAQWIEGWSRKVCDAEGALLNGAYRVFLDNDLLLSADWQEGLPTGVVIGWADGREKEVIRGRCDGNGCLVEGKGPRCIDETVLPLRNHNGICNMQKGMYGPSLCEGEICQSGQVFRGKWIPTGKCIGELINIQEDGDLVQATFLACGVFDHDWRLIKGVKYVEEEDEEETNLDDCREGHYASSSHLCIINDGQEVHREPWPLQLSRERSFNSGWWSEPLPTVDITKDPHCPKTKKQRTE